MAGGAAARDRGVPAVEDEPGFDGMVEGLRIEMAQLGVNAGMLNVAGDALLGVPVHARGLRDAFRDRLVTRQTPGWRRLAADLMARLALAGPFERLMCAGERPGRHQSAELRSRDGYAPSAQGQNDGDKDGSRRTAPCARPIGVNP